MKMVLMKEGDWPNGQEWGSRKDGGGIWTDWGEERNVEGCGDVARLGK